MLMQGKKGIQFVGHISLLCPLLNISPVVYLLLKGLGYTDKVYFLNSNDL